MLIFAIAFGSLVSLAGLAVLIVGIVQGDPGSFILSFFFIGIGIVPTMIGIRRLKEKNAAKNNACTASGAARYSMASSDHNPAVGTNAAAGPIRKDLKDIIVPALEKRLEELNENRPGICTRCKKPVLTKEKFVAELSGMGMTLAPDGVNIVFSGTFRGYDSLEDFQSASAARLQELEGMKAIQCISCGKIYCVDCLARFAPAHRTSGGKACFSCGGALREI